VRQGFEHRSDALRACSSSEAPGRAFDVARFRGRRLTDGPRRTSASTWSCPCRSRRRSRLRAFAPCGGGRGSARGFGAFSVPWDNRPNAPSVYNGRFPAPAICTRAIGLDGLTDRSRRPYRHANLRKNNRPRTRICRCGRRDPRPWEFPAGAPCHHSSVCREPTC
jgi:hypothetical protein